MIDEVPLLDLARIHRPLQTELQSTFQRVLESNHYILGKEVSDFENACADALQVKHAVGVSSGSDALILALMSLGIKTGDEVICPSYTFFATAGAIARLGATPVFVDCRFEDYNLDPHHVETRITPRTKAIIPVHLFGKSADLNPLIALCKKHNLALIEDAAQAIGAQYAQSPVGSFGNFGVFSFFPSKNLGGFGDGGLLTTDDAHLAEQARVLRAHGSKPKYYHHHVGGNFRLDALQAALLKVKLPHLKDYQQQREAIAHQYIQGFGRFQHPCVLPSPSQGHVWNQFVIRLPERQCRDELQKYLAAHKISTAIYYPLPLHLQPCFSYLAYQQGDLPVSEQAAETTLALPIFPGLSTEEQDFVLEKIQHYFSAQT